MIGILVLRDLQALAGEAMDIRRGAHGNVKLLISHLVAGLGPQGVLLQADGDVQTVLGTSLGLGHLGHIGDGDGTGLPVGHVGEGAGQQHVLCAVHRHAVLGQRPVHVEIVQGEHVVLVAHVEYAVGQVILGEPEALVLILDLIQLGLHVAVGRNQTVLAEVARVVGLAVVAAVSVEVAVVLLVIQAALMGEGLGIVVIAAVAAVLTHISSVHPQQDVGAVSGDTGGLAPLGLDLAVAQHAAVNAAHGDLAVKGAALLGVIAKADGVTVGLDGARIVELAAHLLAIHIDAQRTVVKDANHLVPVAHPVFGQRGGHRLPAAAGIVNEELQLAVVVGLKGHLGIALGHHDLIGGRGVGLADHFHGEHGILTGEDLIVSIGGVKGHITGDALVGEGLFIGNILMNFLGRDGALSALLLAQGVTFIKRQQTALVHPVPDEAAQHMVAAADGVPVIAEAAHGVAHGVVVLTEDVRHGFTRLALGMVYGGVHVAAHIHAVFPAGALGVDRAGGIVVLEVPDHLEEHAVGIPTIAGIVVFIAGGPADVGRHVLQTLKGGLGAAERHFLEGLLGVLIVHERVSLQVGLRHHVQAVLIAQPVEIIVVAVMRGADGIEVILLHELHVFFHDLMRDILAIHRVGIMAVGALEDQAVAVDGHLLEVRSGQLTVSIYFRSGELNLAEAQLLGHTAQVVAVLIIKGEDQGIEVGGLGVPQFGAEHFLADGLGVPVAGGDGIHVHRHTIDKDIFFLIVQADVHLITGGLGVGLVAHRHVQLQVGVLILLIQIGADEVVLQIHQRSGVQIDVTEDTAVLVHILEFKPGAVTELMYLHGQGVVLAVLGEVIGDIKAVGAVSILAVAHHFSVDIDVISGFHALEVDVDPLIIRKQAVVYVKIPAVQAHGVIFGGTVRRLYTAGLAALPGGLGIGINRVIEALTGPAAGELNILPGAVVKSGLIKQLSAAVGLDGLFAGVVLGNRQFPFLPRLMASEELHIVGTVLILGEILRAVDRAVHRIIEHAAGGKAAVLLAVGAELVFGPVLGTAPPVGATFPFLPSDSVLGGDPLRRCQRGHLPFLPRRAVSSGQVSASSRLRSRDGRRRQTQGHGCRQKTRRDPSIPHFIRSPFDFPHFFA